MSVALFSASEIFDIAVNIEKNGRAFYLAAVKNAPDAETRAFFQELADWEEKHVELFENLKSQLPSAAGAGDVWDPDGEAAEYLRAAAEGHVFGPDKDGAKIGSQCATVRDVLTTAVAFEKDSVVYYTAMKMAVSPRLGRDRIDQIIEEEMKHIVIINMRLSGLRDA